jgi:TonB-linked SusC/RagA family outer membrane protein
MRLSLYIAILTVVSTQLLFASPTSAQSMSQVEVSIELKKESAVTALKKIESQTNFRFVYRNDQLKDLKQLELPMKKRSVQELLTLVFGNDRFQIKQINTNNIQIVAAPKATNIPVVRISGIVYDEAGVVLPGVSVRVKGDNSISTATDVNGHFGIEVPAGTTMLIFSYLSYQTQEVAIDQRNSVSVYMKPAAGSLNEVQVIGYGTTTRKLNTGSVSSITSEVISKQTVGNPIQALAGRIAGMTVVQNNGLPGSNTTVQIRGNNTLGINGLSGALPLYIVDGVPFTNFNGGSPVTDNANAFGLTGANGGISPFSMINPQDIERIDVLKDADATAIYGARGANGVVLITTKRGKSGKAKLDANIYTGTGKVGHFVEMLNTEQYLEMRKEAFKNDGVTATATNAPDLLLWDQKAHTDWQKLLLGGTATVTDAQLSYSGGNERIRFFTSGNYRKDGTVFPGDMGSSRFSGRMNLQTNSLNNKFSSSFTVNYANDNTDLIQTDVSNALSLPPNYPLYNANGTLNWTGGFTNPYANLLKKFKNTNTNFIANGTLKYNLLKGLNIKADLGYTRSNLSQILQNPLSSQDPSSSGISNQARFANTVSTNYIIEPQAEYAINVRKHTFSALVGTTFQENVSDANSTTGTNYPYEALLNTINGAGTITSSNAYSIYKYASAFGRLNYDYDKRFVLNLTFRRDASSRFGSSHQFANFGAAGAAWIFSDESFVKDNLSFLSFGKLRASYGTTGNDQLPNYQYLALFSVGSAAGAYQGIPSLALNSIPNPDLKWETTRKMEFGLDLGFLKDRILLKADAYWHRSSDLLTYGNLPLQSSFNSINANLDAVVQNRGLEFELNTTNIDHGDFKWTSAFNISFPQNKLLKFDQIATSFYATSFAIGYPITVSKYFSFDKIDPATGAALYNDLDGTSGTNFNTDRYFAGIGTPYFGGLSNTFIYKSFSLDVFLQFNHRMGVLNNIYGTRIGSLNNQNVSALNRWRNPGEQASLPGASANPGGSIYSTYSNLGQSDIFYGDASFLKLRSANLSYTLPFEWTRSLKVSNARIYVQGQNLLTFAKNKYVLDPESSNAMPPLRTIVFGINLTL